MASTYTGNVGLEKPSNGSYNDDWDIPVNADWDLIDNVFGGVSRINVTGIGGGVYALTLQQYQPRNIEFSGALSGSLFYTINPNVGGTWSIWNNTTGAFQIYWCINGLSNYLVPQGQRILLTSDGANMQAADTAGASSALAVAEAFATAADAVVLSTTEAFATNAANVAQSNAQAYAAAHDVTTLATAETFATNAANAAQAAAVTTSEAYTRSFSVPGSSLVTNGYRKNADGSITQWGLATMPASSPATVTFPIPFGVSALNVVVSCYGQPQNYHVDSWNATSFVLSFSVGSSQMSWQAEGK